MEARAKHEFKATQEDDLGFAKGSILNVLDMDQDKNWYKAEQDGREGWIPKTYIEMKPHDVGEEGGNHQVVQCLGRGDHQRFNNQVQHFKVFRDTDRKYYLWNTKFLSLNKLVDHHREASVSRSQHIVLKDMMEAVQALFDFEAQEEGEVSFKRGDCIEVIDNSDVNWWRGKVLTTGEIGMFPSNYVKAKDVNI
ncbi:predicted protein [Nematostella vectensis]|uniref:SH3 domain-containing protein n=1 Tax=Nematostella vectensis TaxID=45351 RepID=A7SE08_NEMVE|nr:predicted protein [Nematostella vectensis]|eukprot:XP_001630139.1 predicted protein [Nematostella vectensis]